MRILIVKTSSLGDIIHAFPVLSFIKKLYPHAEIDWIVEKPFAGLVGAHPLVSKIWTVETKKWRKGIFKPSFWKEIRQLKKDVNARNYDVLFDLQGNIKSALICSQLCVKTKVGYGWQTVHEKPNVFFMDQHFDPPKGVNIRDDNLFLVQSYFKEMSPHEDQGVYLKISTEEEQLISRILSDPRLASRKRLMICPGSAWRNKQVTREALEEFLRLLAKRRDYAFLFVWGTPEEKELVSQLQQHHPDESVVIDRLALPVLQNLMGRVKSSSQWIASACINDLYTQFQRLWIRWPKSSSRRGSPFDPSGQLSLRPHLREAVPDPAHLPYRPLHSGVQWATVVRPFQ